MIELNLVGKFYKNGVLYLIEIIDENLIEPELNLYKKKDIIRYLATIMDKNNRLKNLEQYVETVMEREKIGNTSVGYGVGIPHGKTDAVKVPTLAFGKTKELVKWGEEDDELVNLIFLIGVPEVSSNEHLKILAALSRKLMDENFREKLLNSNEKKDLKGTLAGVFE